MRQATGSPIPRGWQSGKLSKLQALLDLEAAALLGPCSHKDTAGEIS